MNKLEKAIDKLELMQSQLESCWGSCSRDGWDDIALDLIKDCKEIIKNLQEFQEFEVKEMSIKNEPYL